jgi:uncharacterized protein YktB (UPF0637 family)
MKNLLSDTSEKNYKTKKTPHFSVRRFHDNRFNYFAIILVTLEVLPTTFKIY